MLGIIIIYCLFSANILIYFNACQYWTRALKTRITKTLVEFLWNYKLSLVKNSTRKFYLQLDHILTGKQTVDHENSKLLFEIL